MMATGKHMAMVSRPAVDQVDVPVPDFPVPPNPMLRRQYQPPEISAGVSFEGERGRWARKCDRCPTLAELRQWLNHADSLNIDVTHVHLLRDYAQRLGLNAAGYSVSNGHVSAIINRAALEKRLNISVTKTPQLL